MRRSSYPVLVDGWEEQSTWGWDPVAGSYYAALTRNGRPAGCDPDAWIVPPVWPVMQLPEALAQAIAHVTATDQATVCAAMNDSLDADGEVHRMPVGDRSARPSARPARIHPLAPPPRRPSVGE